MARPRHRPGRGQGWAQPSEERSASGAPQRPLTPPVGAMTRRRFRSGSCSASTEDRQHADYCKELTPPEEHGAITPRPVAPVSEVR